MITKLLITTNIILLFPRTSGLEEKEILVLKVVGKKIKDMKKTLVVFHSYFETEFIVSQMPLTELFYYEYRNF